MTDDLTPIRPDRGEGRRTTRLDAELEQLRLARSASGQSRTTFTPGVNLMGIFSRTRDIIAANFNDLLDKR